AGPARHRALPSSPTRRSSDLRGGAAPAPATRGAGTETALVPLLPPTHVGGSEARGNPRDDRTGFRRGNARGSKEGAGPTVARGGDRKSTRLNSSHVKISYAVF